MLIKVEFSGSRGDSLRSPGRSPVMSEIVAVEYDVSAGGQAIVVTHYADGPVSIAVLDLRSPGQGGG